MEMKQTGQSRQVVGKENFELLAVAPSPSRSGVRLYRPPISNSSFGLRQPETLFSAK